MLVGHWLVTCAARHRLETCATEPQLSSAVALTSREEPSVLRNRISSVVLADRLYRDRVHDLEIVDRLGAGDAYSAGLIYGYLQGDWARGVAYAGAMAALKHTMVGDLPWFTAEEIEQEIRDITHGLQR